MQRYNIFRYVLQYFEYFCIKTRKKRHSHPQTMLIPTASMTISSQSGSEEWKAPEQVPEQVPEQARDLLHTSNPLIIELIKVIGNEEFSVSQLMKRTGLKHRPNFIEYHLNPAIAEGYVRLLYPDKPRHPRQKYLLTLKGLAFFFRFNIH